MTYVSQKAGVIFIAGWNALSLFLEYYLLWKVYVSTPALSHKVSKKAKDDSESQVPRPSAEDRSREQGDSERDDICRTSSSEALMQQPDVEVRNIAPVASSTILTRLKNEVSTFKIGWEVYMRQNVARPGICLAMFYFTVLDFGNIATGYAYTQHLSESLLSILRGVGAVFGISATFLYPRLRKKVGLVRTGLFSLSIQFFCMMICFGAVFAPGSPFFLLHRQNSQQANNNNSKVSLVCVSSSPSPSVFNTTVFSSNAQVTYSQHIARETKIQATPSLPRIPVNLSSQSGITNHSTVAVSPTVTIVSASNTVQPFGRECYNKKVETQTSAKHSYISIALLLTGTIMYRLGLWMADLTITQFQQENIPTEERGIVGGMQNAFNSFANLLIIILVIVLHTPQQFGILAILSVAMVGFAGILYASFAYRERGHLFHFDRLKNFSSCLRNGDAAGGHVNEWQPLSDMEDENFAGENSAGDGDNDSIRNDNFVR